MRHPREAAPLPPVGVERVLVRLAQRRPEMTQVLRISPGHILEPELANQTLRHLLQMRRCLTPRASVRAPTLGRLILQVGRHPVAIEEVDQRLRASAWQRHHPAPILGRTNHRQRRHLLHRMAAGLAVEASPPVDPTHQVELSVLGHRIMHGAMQRLHPPRPLPVNQRPNRVDADHLPCDVVGLPDLRSNRRRVIGAVGLRVVATVHHRPAQGQMHQIGAAIVGPRAVVAKRRHARDDQIRRAAVERRVVSSQAAPARREAWRRAAHPPSPTA